MRSEFTYDPVSNLTRVTGVSGELLTLQYDAVGQIVDGQSALPNLSFA